MRTVIFVVGPSCAGKTTACKYLQKMLHGKSYEASDVPRSRHKRMAPEIPLIDFVKNEFESKGKSTFAQELSERIQKEAKLPDPVIIDGFRACEELDFFADLFWETKTIGIFANSRIRYDRYIKRARDSPLMSYLELVKKDMIEYTFGVAKILTDYVDDTIINEKTLCSFRKELSRCLGGS